MINSTNAKHIVSLENSSVSWIDVDIFWYLAPRYMGSPVSPNSQ